MTTGDEASRARLAGDAAWAEMARRGVAPTPQNYAGWFARCVSGAAAAAPALAAQSPDTPVPDAPTPDTPAPDMEEVGQRVACLDEATGEVLEATAAIGTDVSEGQRAIGVYAATLATWGATIRADESASSLLRAVETLSAATAAVMDRNRLLEDRLAASSGRIGRLQARLSDMRTEVRADALTGLCNRRGFDVALKRAVAAAKGGGPAASLLMLDIDHFKRFNDTYGHPAGDLVLRLVGKVLTQNVKGRDVAARYGGEEFAVILLGAGRAAAGIVAEQVRAAMVATRTTLRRPGPDLGAITVSIGVAECRAGDTPAALLERADRALYRAKQMGRDRVCVEEVVTLAWTG